MRYLAVLVFLAGCGVYDAESFEEMPVCYEDGASANPSEMVTAASGPSKDGRAVVIPEPSKDGIYGPVVTAHPSDKLEVSCAKYEIPDEYIERCYAVACTGHCSLDQRMKWPPCGIEYCLPRAEGWVDPGYPLPLEPDSKNNVNR